MVRSNRVPEELWMEVRDIVQKTVIKTIPRKKMQKAKWLSEDTLQIAEKRRKAKGKGKLFKAERYTPLTLTLFCHPGKLL